MPSWLKILRFVMRVPPLKWLAVVIFLVVTMAAFVAVSIAHVLFVALHEMFHAVRVHSLANLFGQLHTQGTDHALDFLVTLYDRADKVRKLCDALDAQRPLA